MDIRSLYHDLNMADTVYSTDSNGSVHAITARKVDATSAQIQIDDTHVSLQLGHFRGPDHANPPGEFLHIAYVNNLIIGLEITKAFCGTNAYERSFIRLNKDVRLLIAPLSISRHIAKSGFPIPAYDWNYGDNWLTRPPYGYHLGIDLYTPPGLNVVSVCDGTVVDVRRFRPQIEPDDYWGNMVSIMGDDKLVYNFMHCSSISEALENGARVMRGQTIGPVGKSGFESMPFGPHLHFEILVLVKPSAFRFVFEVHQDVLPTPSRIMPQSAEGYAVNPLLYMHTWFTSR